MVFSSTPFLFLYLPAVLAVYYAVPRRWRNLWLFLVNLALLGFFKYFDLIASTLSRIPGVSIPTLGLALPIGISFYTFQTMSYPIDVYRGDSQPQRSFITFGTFVALFPQLIAGPIVRYKDVAEQLEFRAGSREQFASGVRRLTVGLAKKVLIANNIGQLWTLYSARDPGTLTAAGAWLGVLAYHFQIYFDFSGYSDMAIGLGRMLGFEFLENFDHPYTSTSVTEYWRRWHISLGNWFRDYVYIPLGGNRHGKYRQLLNILIVWSLTGLWHGANWTYLVWGVYYACFLIIEKVFLLNYLKRAPALGLVYTFFVTVFSWVIFDLPTLSAAGGYFRAMFGMGAGLWNAADLFYLKSYAVMFAAAATAALPLGQDLWKKLPEKAQAAAAPVLIAAVLLLSTAYLVDATYNPFLYFRF